MKNRKTKNLKSGSILLSQKTKKNKHLLNILKSLFYFKAWKAILYILTNHPQYISNFKNHIFENLQNIILFMYISKVIFWRYDFSDSSIWKIVFKILFLKLAVWD